jgi:hypothetical protein
VLPAVVAANNGSHGSCPTNFKTVGASSACRLGDGERNEIQSIDTAKAKKMDNLLNVK